MTISYEEALATLQSMFSHQGYTAQQLDGVLRHHGGHMEHTVETLLSHGEGTPDDLMRNLSSKPVAGLAGASADGGAGDGNENAYNIDADEELARQLAAEDERQQQQQQQRGKMASKARSNQWNGLLLERSSAMAANNRHLNAPPPGQWRRPIASTATASSGKPAANPTPAPKLLARIKGRGIPAVLPVDFLRIPGKKYPVASTASSNGISDSIVSAPAHGSMGQIMTDEQLARMLQDELFQEELRNNPQFSHLAGRRNLQADGRAGSRLGGHMTGRSTYTGAGVGVGWGERTDFFDRLSEMGDNAKRRLQEFATSWNDPNARLNRQSRPLFGGGGAAQSDANMGNERRGLLSNDLNMEEEEEMDFVGGVIGTDRNFEMNNVGGGNKKKD